MGLIRSIKRRLMISEGEPFLDRVKIFVADKPTRIAKEIEKFGERDSLKTRTMGLFSASGAKSELGQIGDATWYAQTHKLSSPKNANSHFIEFGKNQCYAPHPDLAGPDGIHLTQWGAEFLLRLGIQVGQLPNRAMEADDSAAIWPSQIANSSGKKIAVVSAVFGGFDRLLPVPESWTADADFYLFTDRVFENSGSWTLVNPTYHNADPRRKARFVKLHLPFYFSGGYDWVLWVDGNILMTTNPAELLDHYDLDQFDFATWQHPERDSLTAEAAACYKMGKESHDVLFRHLKNVSSIATTNTVPVFETWAMFIRPDSESAKRMSEIWWRLMMQGSKRDQLSLSIAIAETSDLRWTCLPESGPRSANFFRTHHTPEMP